MSGWTIKRNGKIVPGRFESEAAAQAAIAQLGWQREAVAVRL